MRQMKKERSTLDQAVEKAVFGLYQSIEERLAQEKDSKDRLIRIRPEILQMFVTQDPAAVDYLALKDLDNEDFLFAIYLTMCRRCPSDTDLAVFRSKAQKMEREAFQSMMIETVARSSEVAEKGAWLDHYSLYKKYDPSSMLRSRSLAKSRLYEPLHSIYMKLPIGLRILAKKVKLKVWR